jgi:hypothetical protein
VLFFYYGASDLGNQAVRLGTGFSFMEAADGGVFSMSRVRIDDPTAALTIVGHHEFRVIETACAWQTLFKGYFADRNVARADSLRLGVARIWDSTVYDLNAALQFEVFQGTSANRPAETDTVRLAWALTSGYTGPLSTDGSAVFGAGVSLDKQDYRGMTLADLMSDCAQASGNNYWVAYDETINLPRLHYYDPTRAYNTSAMAISNVLADVDESTIFAPSEDWKLGRDPSRVYSGVYYRYGDGTQAVYRHDDAVKTAIGHKRDTTWTDTTLDSLAAAEAKADKWLAEAATELDVITLTLPNVPPAKVNLMRAGQRIQVKGTHLPGYSNYVYGRITHRTVAQSGTTASYYSVDLEITFYSKQAGSRARHRPANQRQQFDKPLDLTQISVDVANWTTLEPLGLGLVFGTGAGWGAENVPWPFTACGVGPGAWQYPYAAGGYYHFTAPAFASQLVAHMPSFGPGATHGNAVAWSVYIFEGTTPTIDDLGTPVVAGMVGTQDIVIPTGLIPWGSDFCLVIWPDWNVFLGGYACAQVGGTRPEETGQLGCGEFSGFPATLSLQYIGQTTGAAGHVLAAPQESPNGTRTTFTLTGWDGSGLPEIHRNGVLLEIASMDATAGTVTLNGAPQSGDSIEARYHIGDSPP